MVEGYFDSLGNITAVTDDNGNAVTYSYDYLGQLIGETNSEGGYTVEYDDRATFSPSAHPQKTPRSAGVIISLSVE